MKNNWNCYKNGPFMPFNKWIIQILNPLRWHKINLKWVCWSIKENLPKKFKYPKMEFDYFMDKFSKRIEWFKEYGYKR